MVRLNRIYTKAGDGGETRLVGGQKVAKDSARIETYGTVDELSSCLGLARAALATPPVPAGAAELDAVIKRVQNELFNLGSDLATLPEDRHPKQPAHRGAPRHGARARDRRLERVAARAAQLRAAGRRLGRRVAAPRAHRLPPRRAPRRRACAPPSPSATRSSPTSTASPTPSSS